MRTTVSVEVEKRKERTVRVFSPVVGYPATDFAADILAAATAALPYIAGGVAAGLVIMVVFLGIRKGIAAMRTTSK